MATENQGSEFHAGSESADTLERRREFRYPVEAEVILRKKDGESIHATAVDISSSGMRLHLPERCRLILYEEVSVEVQLPECEDKPFSSWGLGRVAYLNGNRAGIQLFGGKFDPANPGASRDGRA
jgi:c-di-GMP-binding flagellar brake protein YcgR